jgi:hypothetical protein
MRRRAANFGADALESSTQTFLELLLEQRCVWGDHLIPLAPLSHIFFEVEEEGPGRPCGGIRRVDRVRQGALLKVEDASQKLEASCLHGRLIEAFLWTQRTELISMGRSERHSDSPLREPLSESLRVALREALREALNGTPTLVHRGPSFLISAPTGGQLDASWLTEVGKKGDEGARQGRSSVRSKSAMTISVERAAPSAAMVCVVPTCVPIR